MKGRPDDGKTQVNQGAAQGGAQAEPKGDGTIDYAAEIAQRDAQIAEANHVAMCQTQYPDVPSEFSWGDNGAYGNKRGDQAGHEASVHSYYEYPWDGILHFIGGDSGVSGSSGGSGVGMAVSAASIPIPRYRAAVMQGAEKVWLPWMEGLCDTGGSSDTYAGIEGVGMVDFEVDKESIGGGWYVNNIVGGKLIGVTVYYLTPRPPETGYYAARYRCHWMGPRPAWGKWELDDDDGGAGNDRDQIDMLELTICKV